MQWWADMWNGLAGFFGYSESQWGNAAEWFAAVGTVGALLLGLALWRQEAVRRIRSDADSVIIGGGFGAGLSIRNIGERPIYNVEVRVPIVEGRQDPDVRQASSGERLWMALAARFNWRMSPERYRDYHARGVFAKYRVVLITSTDNHGSHGALYPNTVAALKLIYLAPGEAYLMSQPWLVSFTDGRGKYWRKTSRGRLISRRQQSRLTYPDNSLGDGYDQPSPVAVEIIDLRRPVEEPRPPMSLRTRLRTLLPW